MKLRKIRSVEQLRMDFKDSKEYCGHIAKIKMGYEVSGMTLEDVIKCKDKLTAKSVANGEESKSMLLHLLIYEHDRRQDDGQANRKE